jgi:hypothetical protein
MCITIIWPYNHVRTCCTKRKMCPIGPKVGSWPMHYGGDTAKRLPLAQLLGQLGLFLTQAMPRPHAVAAISNSSAQRSGKTRRRPRVSKNVARLSLLRTPLNEERRCQGCILMSLRSARQPLYRVQSTPAFRTYSAAVPLRVFKAAAGSHSTILW